jgi:hypothetical protein
VLVGALLVAASPALVSRGRWKRIIFLAIPAFVTAVGYGIYLNTVDAVRDGIYSAPTLANLVAHSDRLGHIVSRMAAEFIDWRHWSLLWPAAAVALATLAWRGQRRTATQLALLLMLPLPAYALAYELSAFYDWRIHIETSLSRLYLESAPLALLAVGLACSQQSARDFPRQVPAPEQSPPPSPCH